MKNHFSYLIILFIAVGFLCSGSLAAQSNLIYDTQHHTINFNENRVKEFYVPSSVTSGLIYLEATGGDGGRKRNNSVNSANGGQGAIMGAWFEIGTGSNQIPPGSEVVVIVGQRGESVNNIWAESAGAGGGTAIFYKRSNGYYTLLLVAGGGNGGYADCCTVSRNGQAGEIIECPMSGTDEFCNITNISCSCDCSAGGGGIYDPTQFRIYDSREQEYINCNLYRSGDKGWPGATNAYSNLVKPTGGDGGNTDGNTQFGRGGFGFGGGAGGTSGATSNSRTGGGGFTPGNKDNGGGSFINDMYYNGKPLTKTKRGNTSSPLDGKVRYKIIPKGPDVVCNNITAYLDENGTATVQATTVGAGSSDPDGLDLEYAILDINNQLFTNAIDFTCANTVLPYTTTLVVSSLLNGNFGNSSTCAATITIKAKPTISCKDAVVLLNSTGQGVLEASDIDDGSSTLCGEYISSYVVSPKSFSCSDIGFHTVTLTATDNNGDSNSCTATVQVIDPNPVMARCKDISVDLGENGVTTLSSSDIDDGSGNVCGRFSYANYSQGYSLSPNSFDCSHLNTTQTVTLSIEDPHGAPLTCTSRVTIEQDLGNVAKCKDITISLDASGEVRIRPSLSFSLDRNIDAGSWFSSCEFGAHEIALSQEVFTCADIGENLVSLKVIDDNSGTTIDECVGIVTVQDQAGPVAKCKPLSVQIPTDGSTDRATVWADDLDDGSFDLCGSVASRFVWAPTKRPASSTEYTLIILTDYFPWENSWTLTSGGKTYFSGGPYNYATAGSTITEVFSLYPGRYEFNFYDSFGDGLGSSLPFSTIPDFRLQDESGRVILEGGRSDFDYQKSRNFFVGPALFTDRVYFDCSDLGGTYPVVMAVYDELGNGARCETTVTIEQDLSETAKCKDVRVTLDQSGQNRIRIKDSNGMDFDDGSARRICQGNTNLVLTPDKTFYDYTCADIGPNPVTLELKVNGATIDECTSIVSVLDEAGPVAKCESSSVQLTESGTAILNGTDLDAGSYDACGTISSMQVWNPASNPYPEQEFSLTFKFAGFPSDVSWTLTSGETTYASAGPYTDAVAYKYHTETFNLPPGCFELNIYDSYGDGLSSFSSTDDEFFHLKDEQGDILVEGGIDWDYQISGNFCVEENAFSDDLSFNCDDKGTHPIVLLLRDNYGNGSICETTVTVEDKLAPVINSCPDDMIVSTDTGDCGAWLRGLPAPIFSDNCGGGSLSYSYSMTPYGAESSDYGEGEDTLEELYVAAGFVEIKYLIEDLDGNSTPCTFRVDVVDNEAPVLSSCPDDRTVLTDPEDCGAWLQDLAPPTFSDNCSSKLFYSYIVTPNGSEPPYSAEGEESIEEVFVPSGSIDIKYLIQDQVGNLVHCIFSVKVVDEEVPAIECPPDLVAFTAEGECGAWFTNLPVPAYSDNCSAELLYYLDGNPIQGLPNYQEGGHGVLTHAYISTGSATLSYLAQDEAGNEAECSFTLQVIDEEAPELTCPQDMTVNTDSGECGAFVSLPKAAPVDNCGIKDLNSRYRILDEAGSPVGSWSAWASDQSGFFDLGSYQIQWRAMDASDNQVFCSFTLDVIDEEAPEVICKDVTISFNGEDNLAIPSTSIFDEVTSFDACGTVSFVNQSIGEVSCENVGETFAVEVVGVDPNGNTSSCVAQVSVVGMPCGFEATNINCENGAAANYDPVAESFTLTANDCSGYPYGEYSFVKTELCGDGEIIAHVASLSGDGRVGLIMMENADAEARFVGIVKDLGSRTRTEYRTSTGGDISFKQKNRPGVDWLKIVRVGTKFKTYTSTNGSTWRLAHSVTFSNFEECIQAGLVLYTRSANVPVTAVFDQVRITGDNYAATAQLPGSPVNRVEEKVQQVGPSNLQSTIRLDAAPNPFATQTQIDFSLVESADVMLEIYNLHGQGVQRLENAKLDAGDHRYQWDGTSSTGQSLPAGIYLLRLRVDQKWFTTKLSLINR